MKWSNVAAHLPRGTRFRLPSTNELATASKAGGANEKGRPKHVQLGPDDIAERSLVGEWGWNTTLRLALGDE